MITDSLATVVYGFWCAECTWRGLRNPLFTQCPNCGGSNVKRVDREQGMAWRPRGPVSDGTLPCPETRGDLACTKTIPKGWHENEGHGGGHWFQRPDDRDRLLTHHYDATAAISGLPFETHAPEDCPGRPACNWWELPRR